MALADAFNAPAVGFKVGRRDAAVFDLEERHDIRKLGGDFCGVEPQDAGKNFLGPGQAGAMLIAQGTKLATVNKNQQIDGGKWVSLGRYSFTAGWNRVSVSRWTTPGSQVVADAIRVE